MDMDREGLLNPQGLWNKRGARLGALIAVAALVGFNYVFFEQVLGALGLFSIAWIALLAAVFVLALAESAAEWGFARLVASLAPVPGAIRQLRIPARLSAVFEQLAAPLHQWKWRRLDWAAVLSASRIEELNNRQVRAAGSRAPRQRRAA
jgi:hypothetical protein